MHGERNQHRTAGLEPDHGGGAAADAGGAGRRDALAESLGSYLEASGFKDARSVAQAVTVFLAEASREQLDRETHGEG